MKTVAIVSCNDNYDFETRTRYVRDFFEMKGYNVTFIIADFDHRNKVSYKVDRSDNIEYIHVRAYKKNLSVNRILSHLDFAHGVKKMIKKSDFDIVYHCAPPNYTIKVLSQMKDIKNYELITEIGDMWPETMPVSNGIKKVIYFPLHVWANLRDKYLFNSNAIIAECNLFRNQLEEKTGLKNIKTLYFCKYQDFVHKTNFYLKNNKIELCYLGSINNIIDIETIGLLVKELSKELQVVVHIIGDGENRHKLINTIEINGGQSMFYGKVFSEKEKKDIFSNCDFCLNMMKTTVNVGMTMKSLDYFAFGLPIINNIGGDIEKIVTDEKIGFNIDKNNVKDVVERIKEMSYESYFCMIENVRNIHNKYFCVEKFNNEMEKII